MKEKIRKFMMGRYGSDQLNSFLLGTALVLLVIELFTRSWICNILVLVLLILSYYRMLSKNHQKRYEENQKYLGYFRKVSYHLERQKNLFQQRKTHHIYTCPSCRQKIRIPRGKGRIQIHCPKCGHEFIKKS